MSLKLNLKSFKKIHSDEHTTVLKDHKQNHEIRIAHKGLSPSTKQQLDALPHYSDGGVAGQEVDTDSPQYKLAHSKQFKNKASTAAAPKPRVERATNGDQMHAEAVARYKAEHPTLVDNSYAKGGKVKQDCGDKACYACGGKVQMYNEGTPETVQKFDEEMPDDAPTPQFDSLSQRIGSDLGAGVDKLKGAASSVGQMFSKAKDAAGQSIDEFKQGFVGAGNPDAPVIGPPTAAAAPQEMSAPSPALQPEQAASLQPPPEQPQMPQAAPEQDLATKGGNRMIDGARQVSNASQTMFDDQITVQQDAGTAAKEIQDHYKASLKKLEDERANITEDIRNTHIDPNRLYHSMDTGQKIASILGLIAGGLGASLQGQGPNPALAYLNKLSDQDIEAQKAELGKKENLLSANLRKFGDLKEATLVTKIMQADQTANKLAELAAKSSSEGEKGRYLMLKGQIEMGMAPAQQAVAGLQAISKATAAAGQDPNKIPALIAAMDNIDPKRAQDLRDRHVPGMGLAQTNEGAKIVKALNTTVSSSNDSINRLLQISNIPGKSMDMKLKAEANTLVQTLIGQLREPILGPGTVTDSERSMINSIVPNPTSPFTIDSNTQVKLKTLASKLNSTLMNTARANGIGRPLNGAPQTAYKPR